MPEPYDDPYRPLPSAPPGSEGAIAELAEEEPVTTGTLFLTLILLMMIFGFWAMMYGVLLQR
jgi:hypothetical protein